MIMCMVVIWMNDDNKTMVCKEFSKRMLEEEKELLSGVEVPLTTKTVDDMIKIFEEVFAKYENK